MFNILTALVAKTHRLLFTVFVKVNWGLLVARWGDWGGLEDTEVGWRVLS